MNIPRKPVSILAVAVVVLLGLAGAAYTAHLGPWAASRPPDYGRVIATVDDRPIFLELARARIAGLTTVHGSLADTMGPDWHQQILDSLVDDQLIQEESARLGIAVTDDELQTHVDNLRGQFGSDQAFDAWLKDQGMDLTELERRITLQTLGARVYEAVTKDVAVTIEQIRDYYDSHRSKYEQSDGTRTPLFDVRSDIEQQLLGDARDEAFGAWLQNQRSRATVVVVDPDWWKGLT